MVSLPFSYAVAPFPHQHEELERFGRAKVRGKFWEMGLGKSKTTIDEIAWLFVDGEINGALILAPEGVQRNWTNDELPAHMSPDVAPRMKTFCWSSGKASTKRHENAAKEFLATPANELAILVMSYDSMMTDAGVKAARKFLESRRVFFVLDESQRIKSPSAKRTIRVQAASRYAPYRRILTGTPVDNSPFDVYTQIRFLNPSAFEHLGISDSASFKTFFGVWEKKRDSQEREYDQLITYKNLDRLHEVVESYGTRLLKETVLDLPEKLYERVYFDLDPKQRAVYDALRDDFMVYLHDGELLTAELGLVRLTRLQQATSGYLPSDSEKELRPICDKNPRLRAFRDWTEDVPGKAIVWAKYDIDIDIVSAALRADGHKVVTYDGRTSAENRELAKSSFQRGDARFFVAKPKAAGTGLTLTAANSVAYYNCDYSLSGRLQSEDRAHRIGQKSNVTYTDFCASNTVDVGILQALRTKREIASEVTGDEIRSWI